MKESIFNFHINLENKQYIFNTNNGGIVEFDGSALSKEDKQYLFEKKFYVSDDCNEVEILEAEINENIKQGIDRLELTIALTNQCNFRCIYCYQEKYSSVMTAGTAEKLIKKIQQIIDENSYKCVAVHYFGGEPLMNLDVLKFLDEEIKKISIERQIEYFPCITTNGSLLSNEILQTVKFKKIQLTFDGMENIHNSLRISDEFKFVDEIELLKRIIDLSDSIVTVRMNACVQNQTEIFKFYEYIFTSFPMERIDINLNRMIKYHKEDNFDMLSQKEYAKIFFELKVLYYKYFGKFELPKPRRNPCNFICKLSYAINTDGYCTLCSGNLDEKKVLFEDLHIYNKEEIHFRKECQDCFCLPICLGGCKIQHELCVGACTFEKFYMEEILKFYLTKEGLN